MRLVLWDVDGTLVDSAGIGPDAFPLAFERTVGRPPAELRMSRSPWNFATAVR